MNHDKATPRPWYDRIDSRPVTGPSAAAATHALYLLEKSAVKDVPALLVIGQMKKCPIVVFGDTMEEAEANRALAVTAVNAWDDPAALRERLKELEASKPPYAVMDSTELAIADREADHA